MNLEQALFQSTSKHDWQKLAQWVGDDPIRFSEIMEYFFSDNMRLNQRAASIINECFMTKPELLEPYYPKMIEQLDGSKPDGVVRNTFRIFQFVELPEELMGKLVDKAFLYFGDESQAIAIKVFAMTVLYNATKRWPELSEELLAMIEDKMAYGSAGFKNRGSKIIQKLNKSINRNY